MPYLIKAFPMDTPWSHSNTPSDQEDCEYDIPAMDSFNWDISYIEDENGYRDYIYFITEENSGRSINSSKMFNSKIE